MTLKEAEEISRHVTMLVASRPPNGQLRVSQLRGHRLATIRSAFALDIAKQRQVAGNDPKLREISRAFADKSEFLVGTLFLILCDEDVDRLERLERGSSEFNAVHRAASLKRLDQVQLEEQEMLSQESLDSFDNYCWSLAPNDPLYWRKVYDRLGLSYDEPKMSV